jgi:hypothetical protein
MYAADIRIAKDHVQEYEAVIDLLDQLHDANGVWLQIMENIYAEKDKRFKKIFNKWSTHTVSIGKLEVGMPELLGFLKKNRNYWRDGAEALRREQQKELNSITTMIKKGKGK